jgi:acyl-CoA synthetase (AMP-forming)/AMP-acid ligase II
MLLDIGSPLVPWKKWLQHTLLCGSLRPLSINCEKLPKYKRPKKIFFGEVPRNPTGKIEKPKLRKKYIGMEESFKI